MAAGDVGTAAKHSKLMRLGDGEKSVNSLKPNASTQEKLISPFQTDWSAYDLPMQAYYGTMPILPPFSTPIVASPANPCVWPNKGLTSRIVEAREEKCSGEDWDSIKKCKESEGKGFICGRSQEGGKKAWNSGTDDASQSRTAGMSDKSDDKANQGEFPNTKKRTFDQMLADENKKTSYCVNETCQVLAVGNELVSVSSLNQNMESLASAKMVPEQQIQRECASECQLQQERRKLLNREAARRSRIRKKQEHEELQAKVKELQRETSILASNLKRHSEDCQKLKKKNGFLLAELRQKCSQDVMSYLEAQDPECVLHSVDHEDSSHNQESSSEDNSSSHQNSDASNSDWMDQADSD